MLTCVNNEMQLLKFSNCVSLRKAYKVIERANHFDGRTGWRL